MKARGDRRVIMLPALSLAGIALLMQTTASTPRINFPQVAGRDADSVSYSAAQQPDSARAGIVRLFALSVSQTADSARATSITAAREIARAYDVFWKDSFLVRQVAKFEHWTPGQRAAKVALDSLRRAGNDALGRAGAPSALRLWRASLRRATAIGDSAGQAAALGNIGAGYHRAGKLDSAQKFLTRSRDLAIAIGDHRTAGNAVGMIASVSKDLGDLARAQEMYTRAADLRARSGDTRGLAADQNNLGLIAQEVGDLDAARHAFEAALAINRRENRSSVAAVNLANLANIASMTSDFPGAATLYRETLAIYREGGSARTRRLFCTTSVCSRCAAAITSGHVSRSQKRCRSPTRPAQRWMPWRFARTWHACTSRWESCSPRSACYVARNRSRWCRAPVRTCLRDSLSRARIFRSS